MCQTCYQTCCMENGYLNFSNFLFTNVFMLKKYRAVSSLWVLCEYQCCIFIVYFNIHYEVGTCEAISHSNDDLDDSDVEMNEGIHDSDYIFTPEKSCFNKSTGEMNEDWTPRKHQLGSDFESCNKKTKQRIVKKAMKTINTVLNSIVPG